MLIFHQKISFGSEMCDIQLKIGLWSCPNLLLAIRTCLMLTEEIKTHTTRWDPSESTGKVWRRYVMIPYLGTSLLIKSSYLRQLLAIESSWSRRGCTGKISLLYKLKTGGGLYNPKYETRTTHPHRTPHPHTAGSGPQRLGVAMGAAIMIVQLRNCYHHIRDEVKKNRIKVLLIPNHDKKT